MFHARSIPTFRVRSISTAASYQPREVAPPPQTLWRGTPATPPRFSFIAATSVAGNTGNTAPFNFNGGTLKASASSATFFQGNTGTPVVPITTIVKSGGAIIDTDTNVISILEPLQHDSSLGSTPDGGLTKRGIGTLTLTATNTYSGITLV